MTFWGLFITLLLILDPFGNIPLFVSLLKNLTPARRRFVIVRELVFALIILAVFLFFGQAVLSGLNLGQPALQISGGIILFLIALRMIFPSRHPDPDLEPSRAEPLIVPLAVPMVAGPSAMAYVILLSTQFPNQRLEELAGLGAAWAVSLVVLLLADLLSRLLGERVLTAIERLLGMILTTLAVQMFLQGFKSFLST